MAGGLIEGLDESGLAILQRLCSQVRAAKVTYQSTQEAFELVAIHLIQPQ
jgi:hypothetical protein